MLIIKTQSGFASEVEQVIRQHITYTNFIAELSPTHVNQGFLAWLNAEVSLPVAQITNGVQSAERQWERPSLENTIKVAIAARKLGAKFFWIGYDVFRQNYPKTPFDEAQYRTWYEPYQAWSDEQKKRDGELVDELKALQQPEDVEFFETAHQSSFIGTPLPLYLNKWGIRTILITGIHLDWCVEGNARAARDHGIMPIVIGDACACQKQEDEPAALRRINTFFAPVISADTAVHLLEQAQAIRHRQLISTSQ